MGSSHFFYPFHTLSFTSWFVFPSLVNPPPRKEAGQEGACERADLSAVPLDTPGQGHHGGVFEGLTSVLNCSLKRVSLMCRCVSEAIWFPFLQF